MPEMIVCPDSSSSRTLNVGSSRWNRDSALLKLALSARLLGATARLITGSGTFIDVIATLTSPDVNVSPDLQSTPKSATISPALASATSSMSSLCIRTSRGTLSFFPVDVFTMLAPLAIVPW